MTGPSATLTGTPATAAAPSTPVPAVPTRLASIDAYRGLVMFLMMAEVLRLSRVAEAAPTSGFWKFLAYHQNHVEWVGCSLHDLIQPSFSFLVGVALPFSIASRAARGQSQRTMTWHAVWRSIVLIFLGIFLRSLAMKQTNWWFTDTLSQIGLGYTFLFLLGFRPARDHWIVFGTILVGYWLAFALWPLPPADYNFAAVGVTQGWLETHGLRGFAAHWQKNANLAFTFDRWFLNIFPRDQAFLFNKGGYATLNFIPTLATMTLGLVAGTVLRSGRAMRAKLRWFLVAGAIGLVSGLALGALGLCPVVKRLWTPSWVLFSGGWCFLLLAGFYYVIDMRAHQRWAFPLVVIGANSIAAYVLAHVAEEFVGKNLVTHLGAGVFRMFGPTYQPFVHGAVVLLVFWLMLYWMHRRKVFLKI